MAIRIPRAETVRTVEAVAPEAGQSDYSGLDRIGRQLTQVGSQLRENQQNLDLAEAKTRIYAARKLAQAQADEQGLYGDQYTQFMSTAVAKARDEVSGLTELPEVRRALTNEGMVRQQADEIEFQAEGFRRQIVNDRARIQRTMEINGIAAQSDFHWTGQDFTEDAYDMAGRTRLAAESETGLSEDVREQQGLEASSGILFQAGMEVIRGYTRGGEGDPLGLLNMLIDDQGNILDNRLTQNMTSEHVWRLKQMAEQALSGQAESAATTAESFTKRFQELQRQATALQEAGEPWPPTLYDEFRKVYEGLSAVGNPTLLQNPFWGKHASKMEGWRQTMNSSLEAMQGGQGYEHGRQMSIGEIESALAGYDRWTRSGNWPEGYALPAGPMDDMVRAADGTPYDSQERRTVAAYVEGLRSAMAHPQQAANNGSLVIEYMQTERAPREIVNLATLSADDMEAVQAESRTSLEPILIDAAIPIDPDDWSTVMRRGSVRAPYLGLAQEHYGEVPTLYSREESEEIVTALKEGRVQPRQMVQMMELIGQQPPEVQRRQLRMMSGVPGIEMMAYASAIGSPQFSEAIAKGVAITSSETYSDSTWFETGQSEALDRGINELMVTTFSAGYDQAQQDDMALGLRMAYIATLDSPTGNQFSMGQLEEVASTIFPNGATFAGKRMYPSASDSEFGTLDVTEVIGIIKPEDFGTVFDELALEDDVLDWAAGQTGPELVSGLIRDGDAYLVPDLDEPGQYMVRLGEDADVLLPGDAGLFNGSRMLLAKDGLPLVLNFNNYQARMISAGRGEDVEDAVNNPDVEVRDQRRRAPASGGQ